MTFTVSSKEIKDALTILAKVIAPKNSLPILDNFIIRLEGDKLHMTAADTENIMTTTVSITEGNGEGTFAVNARNMTEALKNIAEMPLTFEVDEKDKKVKVAPGLPLQVLVELRLAHHLIATDGVPVDWYPN